MSDLYLQPGEDGLDFALDARINPNMTGGIDNAVFLSIFVAPWWHNRIAAPGARYVSRLPAAKRGVLSLRVVQDVVASVKKSLQWLTDDGIAASVSVEAEIEDRSTLHLRVVVTEPDRTRRSYVYGLNWESQEIYVVEGGSR